MKNITLFLRKALERCVTTLWLAMAICIAQASLARAADYSLVFEKSFLGGPSHPVVAHALIRTRDGGYAFTARIGATESWVVKTNSNGYKEWEQVIKAIGTGEHLWQVGFLVLEAQDGGFLLGGDTNSRDLVGEWKGDMVPQPAFVAKLDSHGALKWMKTYGLLELPTWNSFICGVSTVGGFVLIGQKTRVWPDQPAPHTRAFTKAVWIVKINPQGDAVWEREIAEDGADVLDALRVDPNECAAPIIDSEGHIVFAVGVQDKPTMVRDGKRILEGGELRCQLPRKFVLVVKLDQNGNELARRRLEDGQTPKLFFTTTGYLAVDNPVPVSERGVRQTRLGRNLQIAEQKQTKFEKFPFVLKAALLDKDGGLHLAGHYMTQPYRPGPALLAYLSSQGQLKGIETIGQNTFSSAVGMVRGELPNEIVLLRWIPQQDVKLSKFRFSD